MSWLGETLQKSYSVCLLQLSSTVILEKVLGQLLAAYNVSVLHGISTGMSLLTPLNDGYHGLREGGVVHSNLIVSNPEQLENALPPICVTELGMDIEVRLVQLLNALPPIVLTESPSVAETRLEQPENA